MDLQTLANIGEFIGGFAIVVSLVYLVVNVRQNTAQLSENLKELQRVEMRSTYEQHDRFRTATLDKELAEIWLKGLSGEGLSSPADRLRFSNLMVMTTYATQNNWECVRRGVMDSDEWDRILPFFSRMLANPGAKKWWEGSKHVFQPTFVDAIQAHRQRAS